MNNIEHRDTETQRTKHRGIKKNLCLCTSVFNSNPNKRMKTMNKKILSKIVAAAVLAMGTVLTSCDDNKDNAIWWSDVPYIDGTQNHAATLELGQTLQLKATTRDGEAVEWTSSNPAVATVTADGLVTAVALGEATITVYPKEFDYAANGNYIVVTVVDNSLPLVDDGIDQSEAE